MKTDKVFNTVFETSLRILILLDESEVDLDEQTIRTVDFMATYGKEFMVSDDSANGDNPYMFCELSARKALVDEALRRLVIHGHVLPTATNAGFFYRTTFDGHCLARSLKSDYSKEYRLAALFSLEKVQSTRFDLVSAAIKKKVIGSNCHGVES